MPRRRHHLHMKRYNDCFTGAEATDWLKHNLNPIGLLKGGGRLSRQQAVKVLEMCVKFDVIEDVRCLDGTMTSFRDDRKHLYHFVTGRPSLFSTTTTGGTAEDATSNVDSNKDTSLCISNSYFLQSPGARSMARVSTGSATKTPTRKRRRVLGEVDINQMSGTSASTITQSDVTKIWQEHIIAR